MSAAQAQDAASLQSRHAALKPQLASNQFQRPLHLESSEASGVTQGDVYAVIEQDFGLTGPVLQGLDHWCGILILHLNVKQCRPNAGDILNVHIGRKFDQPLADTHQFQFSYRLAAAEPDYLQVLLAAAHGPMGTSDYRILLEVVALDPGRSFLHLSYAYRVGATASAATRVYLATIGRRKVGFSVVGRKPDGRPTYIAGTRGAVERNSMRFYLAIEAYLGARSAPEPERFEKQLSDWFAGSERYPVQLHEMERNEYLDMKRRTRRSQ
jgi:hypothetical protein